LHDDGGNHGPTISMSSVGRSQRECLRVFHFNAIEDRL
jgi:hypothetical protein